MLWAMLAPLVTVSAQQPTDPREHSTIQPATTAPRGTVTRQTAAEQEPLARFVPIEASIYFRMSDHDKWQALLGGADAFSSIEGEDVQRLLQGRPRVIAMPSWRERKEMITICRPNDAAAFSKLLNTSSAELVKQDEQVKIYHLPTDLWIATDDQVFVLSDIGKGSAMFAQSAKMLSDPERKSLLGDRRFRDYMRQVDPAASGVLFVDEAWQRRSGHGDAQHEFRPGWLPDLESGCVQIHLESDQIRCQLRSARRELHPPLKQAIDARQLKLLPRSTIAAWMMPVEMISLVKFGTRYLPRDKPSFYRQLARTVETYGLTGILPLSEIGPRSAWCMLSGGEREDSIRLAYMIEAKQAAVAVVTLAQICRGVAGVINAHQLTAGREVSVKTTEYKTHSIHELTIKRLDGEEGSRLFAELRPSFSAVGQHLVLASDPGVIREIIDAAAQSEYALPLLDQWAAQAARSSDDTQVRGFINPEKIAIQLAPFQKALQDSDSELLQDEWFQSLRDYFNATPVRLGARLLKDNPQTPGKVYVRHVLEGRPADGKLRPGDFITGIDGELLSLVNPTDDLRKKLQARPGGGVRRLRIERHGKVREVEIFLPQPSNKSLRGVMDDTGNAIGYLSALGNIAELVTYRQFGTSPSHLNAEIVFRLKAVGSRQ